MPPRLLNNFLEKIKVEKELADLLQYIARAGKFVAHAIKTGDLGMAGTSNLFGEHQMALDILSDKIFTGHLKATGLVNRVASEEKETDEEVSKTGKFCVAFDPLDGSSLISSNLSVGAIFGIYRGKSFIGKTGRDMEAACYLIFGPRTIFVAAVNKRVFEFTMNELGEFVVSKDAIEINPDSETFSPGNLRACKESSKYRELVDFWREKQLTLRYSGGMVPDIHAIIAKSGGVFSYPSTQKYPDGKLRLLFECAPFAFIVENAGGLAKTDTGKDILDIKVTKIHQRTPIIIGSKNEVKRAVKYLK